MDNFFLSHVSTSLFSHINYIFHFNFEKLFSGKLIYQGKIHLKKCF